MVRVSNNEFNLGDVIIIGSCAAMRGGCATAINSIYASMLGEGCYISNAVNIENEMFLTRRNYCEYLLGRADEWTEDKAERLLFTGNIIASATIVVK